jgi:hypothetical protein
MKKERKPLALWLRDLCVKDATNRISEQAGLGQVKTRTQCHSWQHQQAAGLAAASQAA